MVQAWPCISFTRLPALVPLTTAPPFTSFGGRGPWLLGREARPGGGERASAAGRAESWLFGALGQKGEVKGWWKQLPDPRRPLLQLPGDRGCRKELTGQLAAVLFKVAPRKHLGCPDLYKTASDTSLLWAS